MLDRSTLARPLVVLLATGLVAAGCRDDGGATTTASRSEPTGTSVADEPSADLTADLTADAPAVTPLTPEAAAARLCPVMWDWVKAVGASFNAAAEDVADIPDADGRRDRWEQSFQEIEALDRDLRDEVAPLLGDPTLGPLIAEIERDLPRADAELDDIRALFVDHPEIDERRHQERTSQVIVRIEKVIDLPKPDLVPHDPDGTLLAAFREVPSCQHAIRDVDDGTPRSND